VVALVRVGSLVFGLYLIALAALKLASGHEPHYALSAPWFYGAACFELGAGLLCCRWRQAPWGLGAAALLFAGALAFALWRGPSGGSCGCLGSAVALAWKDQLRLAIGSGALASLLLWSQAEVRRTDRPGRRVSAAR